MYVKSISKSQGWGQGNKGMESSLAIGKPGTGNPGQTTVPALAKKDG
jgi:hypothetical protein